MCHVPEAENDGPVAMELLKVGELGVFLGHRVACSRVDDENSFQRAVDSDVQKGGADVFRVVCEHVVECLCDDGALVEALASEVFRERTKAPLVCVHR